MKKIILLAGILTAGIVSANVTSSNNVETIATSKSEKETKLEIENLKMLYPIYYTTSCGIAAVTYNNNMSIEELFEWTDRLEQNYCGDDSPYFNTSGL